MGAAAQAGAKRDLPAILAVLGLTVLGAVLRIGEIEQSLYGDELWSYAAATSGGVGDVLDFVRSDQEITPPLFSLSAWLAAKLGDAASLIRLPSLVAGVALIPLVWLLGLRTVGRRAALAAAALAALSPFLAFYAVEARAYSLAMAFVVASTILMLMAVDRRRWGWWAGYAALSCLAMYSHYTAAFPLAGQLLWLLWRHPEARMPALVANVTAAVAFLPWLPSALDDVNSPSQDIIGSLAPFNLDNLAGFTASWSIGHPAKGLGEFWGAGLEVALFAGIVLGLAGAAVSARRNALPADGPRDGVLLVAFLAVACPLGAALVSLLAADQFLPRNLAASWPAFALLLGWVLTAGPRPVRIIAPALVLAVFAVGAWRTTEPDWGRPDIGGAAAFIEANTEPGDVVLDALAPGGSGLPIGRTLDLEMQEPYEKVAIAVPADVEAGVAGAPGRRVALVGPPLLVEGLAGVDGLAGLTPTLERTFAGTLPTVVAIYDVPAGGRG